MTVTGKQYLEARVVLISILTSNAKSGVGSVG